MLMSLVSPIELFISGVAAGLQNVLIHEAEDAEVLVKADSKIKFKLLIRDCCKINYYFK